ncbi:hypothetical protein JTB14_023603 [Gonioctena quinquepunctata]|nr:hypothetical protein JTB14_023603 [Gonioctena quinquepunctata]
MGAQKSLLYLSLLLAPVHLYNTNRFICGEPVGDGVCQFEENPNIIQITRTRFGDPETSIPPRPAYFAAPVINSRNDIFFEPEREDIMKHINFGYLNQPISSVGDLIDMTSDEIGSPYLPEKPSEPVSVWKMNDVKTFVGAPKVLPDIMLTPEQHTPPEIQPSPSFLDDNEMKLGRFVVSDTPQVPDLMTQEALDIGDAEIDEKYLSEPARYSKAPTFVVNNVLPRKEKQPDFMEELRKIKLELALAQQEDGEDEIAFQDDIDDEIKNENYTIEVPKAALAPTAIPKKIEHGDPIVSVTNYGQSKSPERDIETTRMQETPHAGNPLGNGIEKDSDIDEDLEKKKLERLHSGPSEETSVATTVPSTETTATEDFKVVDHKANRDDLGLEEGFYKNTKSTKNMENPKLETENTKLVMPEIENPESVLLLATTSEQPTQEKRNKKKTITKKKKSPKTETTTARAIVSPVEKEIIIGISVEETGEAPVDEAKMEDGNNEQSSEPTISSKISKNGHTLLDGLLSVL